MTKAQFDALTKFSNSGPSLPRSLGVRRDVAWRLVDMGFLTPTGAWTVTDAGRAALAAQTKGATT